MVPASALGMTRKKLLSSSMNSHRHSSNTIVSQERNNVGMRDGTVNLDLTIDAVDVVHSAQITRLGRIETGEPYSFRICLMTTVSFVFRFVPSYTASEISSA